jgi:hypothetical protein
LNTHTHTHTHTRTHTPPPLRFLRQIGCPGNGPGHLQYPYGITIENGLVYVADRNNHRVQVRGVVEGPPPF